MILRRDPGIFDSSRLLGQPSAALPPGWAGELLDQPTKTELDGATILESGEFCLVQLHVAATESMDGPGLQEASAAAYRALRAYLQQGVDWHPLRIWNFVPHILGDAGQGMDRYMRFNAGRYQAFSEWFGGPHGFERSLPTASAVGYDGTDLVVWALCGRAPGVPVANPRQVSPHCYSKRFGPLPPCFSRATRVTRAGHRDLLLVGGTSSVRGEDSVFVGNLRLQLAETLENLSALVREAFGPTDRPLAHYRALRVYFSRKPDLSALQSDITAAFPALSELQWQPAELCRGDLLVEVEGLAGPM